MTTPLQNLREDAIRDEESLQAFCKKVLLSEVITLGVSQQNLCLPRSKKSVPDNSCFPKDSSSKSIAVIIV
jgi:hypothetical protein